jgi:hypothetical protein
MIFIVEWARTADGGRVRVDNGARTLSGGARRRRLGTFGLWTCDPRK